MAPARQSKSALEPTRVREIGEAALRVFARAGVEGATMQAIADEAGLAKGTLYLYFESRLDLVDRLAQEAFAELKGATAEALGAEGAALSRLEAAVRRHVEFFERRRDLFRLFLAVAHPGPGPERSARISRSCNPLYGSYLDLLAAFLAEGQARGELAPFPHERMARFVAEGLAGLVLRRLGETEPPPVEEDVRLVVGLLAAGIASRRDP